MKPQQNEPAWTCLVQAVVSVALVGREGRVFAPLAAAQDAHRLAVAPLGARVGALLAVDGRSTVLGERAVHARQGLVTRLLRRTLVPGQVTTAAARVRELIAVVLRSNIIRTEFI